ncbi:MAG: hypothetical protein LC742_09530 [Acidobacteria bacterium]|nr:hypothetical protein [Acidobacteriota bacterium]
MKKNLPLVLVTLLAVATLGIAQTGATSKSKSQNTGGSLEQMIVGKSRETWEAYKSRNIAAIKALTAEEYVSYGLTGPSNLGEDIT